MDDFHENRKPVLILGFNRPEKIRLILQAVHEYGPSALYYAVDGARSEAEEELVGAVRAVVDEFAWECSVHRLFSKTNLGSRYAVQRAVSAFFSRESDGLILEDDCLPAPDFFRFCEKGLDRYKNDSAVGMIAGTNFLGKFANREWDALFSDGHIWGWATWADRWEGQSVLVGDSARSASNLRKYYGVGWPYRRRLIDRYRQGKLDAWDIPWLASLAKRGMWCLIPTRNLVTNIGHGIGGTHTTGASQFADIEAYELPENIQLPSEVAPTRAYQRTYALRLRGEALLHRARRPLVSGVRRMVGKFK